MPERAVGLRIAGTVRVVERPRSAARGATRQDWVARWQLPCPGGMAWSEQATRRRAIRVPGPDHVPNTSTEFRLSDLRRGHLPRRTGLRPLSRSGGNSNARTRCAPAELDARARRAPRWRGWRGWRAPSPVDRPRPTATVGLHGRGTASRGQPPGPRRDAYPFAWHALVHVNRRAAADPARSRPPQQASPRAEHPKHTRPPTRAVRSASVGWRASDCRVRVDATDAHARGYAGRAG